MPERSLTAEEIVRPLIPDWRDEGAQAVVLVGSHARGVAGRESDVDVVVVGDGRKYRLEVHAGVLVSVSWVSEDDNRSRLYEPRYLATHVRGWRDAVVLDDPGGVAESIVAEARSWSWALVADRCDAWVAETVTSYAEEVLKLVAAVADGHDTLAAAERDILVIHLALPMALRHRILCTSENELWDRVAAAAGPEWREAQSVALAVNAEGVRPSCIGALRLFSLAARDVEPLLDERQHAVVELALNAAQPVLRGPA